jgi:pentapeptide MXKDX repeat protein
VTTGLSPSGTLHGVKSISRQEAAMRTMIESGRSWLVALTVGVSLAVVGGAWAQGDTMKKDMTKQGEMKGDMAKDGMKDKAMKHDGMMKDDGKKGEMKSDMKGDMTGDMKGSAMEKKQ